VYDDWGFGARHGHASGVTVLFSGPPGTGKTMAAGVIARRLGLDLYRIDLSSVVSKYVGETEQNLDRIFAAAEISNAILLFDEADALFGRRTETRDAHDRYANLEVSYLLQRVETYDGVAILASNLRKNIDDAFTRRMRFAIEFPLPGEAERRRIWERVWPEELPLEAGLDAGELAARFDLAGGGIRNVAVAAAFLAAADGGRVRLEHVLQATRREYEKTRRILHDGEFSLGAS
jgi:SpoVK/Ycf46/Vps4 family AAA+-type ATPase